MTKNDWDGAAYHRVSNPQFEWGLEVLGRLSLQGNETVLDAGRGTGRLTAKLLERLPHGRAIAVDASSSMLQVARQYLVPLFGDRVSFLQADLQGLSLEQVADGIFSTATFHWIRDHAQLFVHLFAALRPGGFLIAQCGGAGNLSTFHERATSFKASEPFAPYYRDWQEPWNYADAKTTEKRLRDAGFVDTRAEIKAAPSSFTNAKEYSDFITAVVLRNHLAPLPDALRASFVAGMVEKAKADNPPYTLDYRRLNLRAIRPPRT